MTRFNLGCGQNPMEGWTNVDWIAGPGVDLVVNLEDIDGWQRASVRDNSVEEVVASHLIEHINDPLAVMENLWRACKDGAKATFLCPYGSSDDADEDPTHVRRMFINSWAYFSQPIYWRGNTEYVGDWRVLAVQLRVSPEVWATCQSLNQLATRVHRERNVVHEMVAVLECVKPARARDKALIEPMDLIFEAGPSGGPFEFLGGVKI
jgi:hypothetical protein